MMMTTTIKFAYRQIIDASSPSDFERNVFNDTYAELLIQANVYNRERRFNTVDEMIAANPKANSLHYKVGFAIGLYVNEFKKKIPGLTDTLGNPVSFDIFKTEIVHSDLSNKSLHKMALTYISSPHRLMASFGNYLVLAIGDETKDEQMGGLSTFTLSVQPNIAIVRVKLEQTQEV